MTHGWRTSSFSSNGASCVEILEADGATYLRDTKAHGEGAVLHLDGPAWSAFLRETSSDAVLLFRDDEWTAFRRGVLAGEFGDVAGRPGP